MVGWALLFLLFTFTLYGALKGSLTPQAEGHDISQTESALKIAFDMEAATGSFSGSPTTTALKEAIAKVKPWVDKDKDAADLWVAANYEKGTPVPLEKLPKLTSDVARSIYEEKKLTTSQLAEVRKQLPGKSFLDQLMLAHAAEKAGDKTPRAHLGDGRKFGVFALVGLGGFFLLFGSFLGVIFLITAKNSGSLTAMGGPQAGISLLQADRLALRAAQVFTAFIGISTFIGVLGYKRLSDASITFASGGLMIAVTILLAQIPVNGEKISLASLGVNTKNLGRNVGLGLLGFMIELPIAMFIGLAGQQIFKFLPEPHHPANDSIATGSAMTLAATLFFAAVVAPFWEEIMFRGLLFPALSRVTRSTWKGVAFSSLLFAAIHPQGISLWLALGTVAVASCMLAHYTKSLVPSIVLHAAHNFTLITVGILIYR